MHENKKNAEQREKVHNEKYLPTWIFCIISPKYFFSD